MASDSSAGTEDPVVDSSAKLPETGRRTLGKYELVRKIGAGGMGTVFLAMDTQLKRTVALKVLPRERASNPTLVMRFQSEAQAAAQLKHDNIVTVYDAGNVDGHLFIALEYVEGTDVYDLVTKRGSLPVPRSIEIIKQVARALEHAHKQGIVHRDIKPSNLLLNSEGMVKLTDMGLARSIDETMPTGITREGTTVGTVDYMAPEQARDSQAADIRSDIYSLGCTWYQMLTASAPFPTGSVTNKLYAHVSKPRPDPRSLNKLVPESVVVIMHKMMARKAIDRYQTPTELLKALENIDLNVSREQALVLEAIQDDVDTDESLSPADSGVRSARRLPPPTASPPARDTDRRPILPPREAAPGDSSRGRRLPPPKAPASERRSPPPTPPRKELPPVKSTTGSSLPKRTLVTENESDEGGFSIEFLDWQKLGMVLGLLLAVGVGGYLVLSFSGLLDSAAEVPLKPVSVENAPQETPAIKRQAVRGKADESSKSDPLADQPPRTEPEPAAKAVEPAAIVNRVRVAVGRQGEGDVSPAWLNQVWNPAQPREPSPFSVGRADGEPAKFPGLAEALEALPAEGGVVELVGDGPFVLPSIHIETRGSVVITATTRNRPLILLAPDHERADQAAFAVFGGTLVLSGVDLAAVGRQLPGNGTNRLVSVAGGGLVVRNCSLTLHGKRTSPTSAFHIGPSASGAGSLPSRVFLENVCVRGENLTALECSAPLADLLASNCLFAVGRAPALLVAGENNQPSVGEVSPVSRSAVVPVSMSQASGRPPGNAFAVPRARTFRFFSNTIFCNSNAFAFDAAGSGVPPATELHVLNSVVSQVPTSAAASLLQLTNWSDDVGEGAARSAPANLGCVVENSQLLGWKTLLRKDQGPKQTVADPLQWQQMWGKPVDLAQFRSEVVSTPSIADFATVEPAKLGTSLKIDDSVKATDGGRTGCDLSRLAVPTAAVFEKAVALAARPRIPEDLFPVLDSAKRTINLDDRTVDLGRIISGDDWESGTTFEITGTGPKSSSPIRVRNKSLRIEFDAAARAGMTVQFVDSNKEKGDANAFISVSGGNIEIVNANFKILLSTSGQHMPWLLGVTDGSFSVRNSSLVGQLLVNPVNEGLIRWSRSSGSNAVQTSGDYEQFAHVTGSYLVSRGVVLSSDVANCGALIERSLLASPERIFALKLSQQAAGPNSAVEVRRCSLSAGREFFDVSGAAAGRVALAPLRLFVENTAFLPPPAASDADALAPAVVLSYAGYAKLDRQVEWWEDANGYAESIGPFQVDSTSKESLKSSGVSRESWPAAWDGLHIVRPLLHTDGVLLAKELPKLTEMGAEDFRLLPNSKATAWTATGEAIGARIDELPAMSLKGNLPKPAAKTRPEGKLAPKNRGF